MNDRIPIEHREQSVIEEFAGGLLFCPSTATILVYRSENRIRVAGTVHISADHVSSILAGLKTQMEPHRSFRNAAQGCLKGLLRAGAPILRVGVRVNFA